MLRKLLVSSAVAASLALSSTAFAEDVFEPPMPSEDFQPENTFFFASAFNETSDDVDLWGLESGLRVLFDDNWSGRGAVTMFHTGGDFFEGLNFGATGSLLYAIGNFNPDFSARPMVGFGAYIASNECDDEGEQDAFCKSDMFAAVYPELGFSIESQGVELYLFSRYTIHPSVENGVMLGASVGYKL
ncbi:hypothetical protein FJM67_06850 [Maribrevibacterium harenarium]|uniref:Outer membrane protein beta-barrel domain-containing protein n=1 Tax=Maribrevibacterium harenarium TaxID=2589817 RepID=A0A501WZV4_9GAMM|nr:hypothetical protein [Maribrevibacterium harenarium]TPE53367.1 hypothetical protein FJM67_06850 [Maribrevibacterium harenarium]